MAAVPEADHAFVAPVQVSQTALDQDSADEGDVYGDAGGGLLFTGLYGLIPDSSTEPLPMFPRTRVFSHRPADLRRNPPTPGGDR